MAAIRPPAVFCLTGSHALVTGASRGLGRSIADGLAAAGADVTVLTRDPSVGEERSAALAAEFGIDAGFVTADVCDEDQVAAAVAQAGAARGNVTILVNAAGVMVRGTVADTPAREFRHVMDVNALGTWNMCRAVVPQMVAAGGGRIVNVASTLALIGSTERGAYAASKGAVALITRSLAMELAPERITVNAVAPGPFRTDMTGNEDLPPRMQRILEVEIPMRRMADPSELQGPVVFLASPAASFVTGVVLPVDGGRLAH